MKKMVITILDGISETSMPFNEFVMWRINHCPEEEHTLIIIGGELNSKVELTKQLRVLRVSRNPFIIRKKIGSFLKEMRIGGIEYCIHLHQLKSASLAQLAMLGTGFRKKTIFTVHSTFTGYALHNKIQSYFNGLMAEYVACVSQASYNKYPASLKSIKGNRVISIRNGVDTDRINTVLVDSIKEPSKGFVQFIYVARIIPIKNHRFLIDVIKETDSRAFFVFVGHEGDGSILDIIKEANLEHRIKLTGLLPRQDVFNLLNNSDVYVSTSTLEGMPISVLEAMYCGLPSLLSNIPQHKEIGGDSEYVSYLPFNKTTWIHEINKYTLMNVEERRCRGEKAKMYVDDNFSLYDMHDKYSEIYKMLQQC